MFELLREKRVNVSADGKAVYADFELDIGVFASMAISNENKHFHSGGLIAPYAAAEFYFQVK